MHQPKTDFSIFKQDSEVVQRLVICLLLFYDSFDVDKDFSSLQFKSHRPS